MPLPDACDIDDTGRFKYILIEAIDSASGEKGILVRGYARCPFHSMENGLLNGRFFVYFSGYFQ